MKNYFILFALIISVAFYGCGESSNNQPKDGKAALDPAAPQTLVQNIEAAKLKEKLAGSSNLVLLDVRTPDEWSGGTIAGATKIDFQNGSFKEEVAKLDKNKSYVVYCAAGGRSADAADLMAGMGFTSVTNLVGGITSWEESGGEIVK